MNREKIKSVYLDLVKLYKSAPEGSFTKICLQLACRSVQVAYQSKSMQKVRDDYEYMPGQRKSAR